MTSKDMSALLEIILVVGLMISTLGLKKMQQKLDKRNLGPRTVTVIESMSMTVIMIMMSMILTVNMITTGSVIGTVIMIMTVTVIVVATVIMM